jgi:MOSC domain-containing protein YiiM
MDLSFRHDFWLARLPASPNTLGRLERIVVRPRNGERDEPGSVEVSVERGIHGDRWEHDDRRRTGAQISLMNVHVLRAIAGDDASRMALAGDNLIVDLDLSEANLPVGSLLTIDQVVLQVSAEPHRPCAAFLARFGVAAARRVARGTRTGRRTRGVLASVVQAGTLRAGASVHVKRPGSSCLA